jgi:large subunit ribosomal protein L6
MSRIANSPVIIPTGVDISINNKELKVKGSKGDLSLTIHDDVEMNQVENRLEFKSLVSNTAKAGTMRALVANMVFGVTEGFNKKLLLNGVGYRAKSSGSKLDLTLGFSHPVVYQLPEGIKVETPTQTEIIVSGIDKQLVGQVSSEIRAFRPPEPYKGKGVRYADEHVKRKEAKKK